MRRKIIVLAVIAFAIGFAGYAWQRHRQASLVRSIGRDALSIPVLMEGLGDHEHRISTSSAEVQRWFDQGLRLSFAFNHEAALRAFHRATQLNEDCAMCWWGAALVLGPHINAGMDPANVPLAWERLQNALATAPEVSDRERAYIKALGRRYEATQSGDRRTLDIAYAEAMREVVARYPDDIDAKVLLAEALMDLHPWDFHDEHGAPKLWTAEIVELLEGVLATDPEHPGANHYYIHAVEASSEPERALPSARRLLGLMPAAGHMLHMPAHIFMRTGRYHEASEANALGIQADQNYLILCKPGAGIYARGYVPHNHHFLMASASMEGAGARALEAARAVAQAMDLEQSRQPGYAALQHYWAAPLYGMVRFGRWSDILQQPQPAEDLAYPNAVWRYARGMALVKQGQHEAAQFELKLLAELAADPAMTQLSVWGLNDFASILKVAERVLAGELAAARKEYGDAVAALRQAVDAEEALRYDEPAAWYFPVRQTLGAVLLEADRSGAAQAVFEQDLRLNRENGWSLFGLAQSFRAQGRKTSAEEVEARFEQAWRYADVELRRAAF